MDEMIYRVTGDGRRADVLLSEQTGISRSRVAALMAAGYCLAGGKPCEKAGTKAIPGTEFLLRVPAPRPAIPQAENLPLEIVYQDADLAVVVKPRGMVVHPAPGHEDGTLVNALLHHLETLGGIGGELRPGIVHRLDKDTSGLMIVACNDESQAALSGAGAFGVTDAPSGYAAADPLALLDAKLRQPGLAAPNCLRKNWPENTELIVRKFLSGDGDSPALWRALAAALKENPNIISDSGSVCGEIASPKSPI